jgi:hypothetical protein
MFGLVASTSSAAALGVGRSGASDVRSVRRCKPHGDASGGRDGRDLGRGHHELKTHLASGELSAASGGMQEVRSPIHCVKPRLPSGLAIFEHAPISRARLY